MHHARCTHSGKGYSADLSFGYQLVAASAWRATLLYVTHDISETRAFDRVFVIDNGQLVENGEPLHLAQTPSTRYRRMLQTQEAVLHRLVTTGDWKRIRLESGRLLTDRMRANEHTA